MSNHRRTFLQQTVLVGSGLIGAATGASAADTDPNDTDATDANTADADATPSARIEGTVTHFGTPVADATVTAGSETSTATDETGAYALSLERGEYALEVTAPGYASTSIDVVVAGSGSATRDFRLEREWGPEVADLEVFVTPAGGGSTIPCEIAIFGDERYSTPAPRGSVPDGENWERGFEVDVGWWEILVTDAEGYSDGYRELLVEDGEPTFGWVQLAEGDDTIPDAGTIDGTVTDGRGAPVSDATVTVASGERATTGDGGGFELELEHGRHRIEASADGYEPVAGDVQVKFARTTALNVTLRSRRR